MATTDLVIQRFQLVSQRRTNWLRKLWSQEGDFGAERLITHAEVDTLLGNRDTLESELLWADTDLTDQVSELQDIESLLNSDLASRFARLTAIFGLSPHERDLLEACYAYSIQPKLSRVVAYLQDHAGKAHLTAGLVARLYSHHRSLAFESSMVAKWQLVRQELTEPGQEQALVIDEWVAGWLSGDNHLDPSLSPAASNIKSGTVPKSWPLSDLTELIRPSIASTPSVPVRINISGRDGGGRSTFAAAIAARLDMPVVVIDSDRIPDNEWNLFCIRANRCAMLNGSAVIWKGERLINRSWPNQTHLPLQFIVSAPGQFLAPVSGVADHIVELTVPDVEDRTTLWKSLIPESQSWPAPDLVQLVQHHNTWPGEIANAALYMPASVEEASVVVRRIGRDRLGNLAKRVETPFRFSDLVIHRSLLTSVEDIIFEARERPAFWEKPEARRLFPLGRGLLSLFSGPSGTGKTMATQVIANELEMDLYRVNLSSVVSKWVGESSKNLEKILNTASNMNIVLLFDEADALFGKRTEVNDAHDRFANTDTNYLLQAIEDYEGIAILASNKKSEIDHAFIRRLRHVLEFREPDADQRFDIWCRVIGELVDEDQARFLEAGLQRLAHGVEATGAQIKYAILSGIFLARRERRNISVTDLATGLDRELMKSGRSLSENAKQRLVLGD
jgi:predicted ABC-type ATPase